MIVNFCLLFRFGILSPCCFVFIHWFSLATYTHGVAADLFTTTERERGDKYLFFAIVACLVRSGHFVYHAGWSSIHVALSVFRLFGVFLLYFVVFSWGVLHLECVSWRGGGGGSRGAFGDWIVMFRFTSFPSLSMMFWNAGRLGVRLSRLWVWLLGSVCYFVFWGFSPLLFCVHSLVFAGYIHSGSGILSCNINGGRGGVSVHFCGCGMFLFSTKWVIWSGGFSRGWVSFMMCCLPKKFREGV